MRFYEYEAKALVRRAGIATAAGALLRPGDPLPPPAADLPLPWVLKSQVLSGGRMKAGAIRFCETSEQADREAEALWQVRVNGLLPAALLIEPRSKVAEEFYAGVAYDQAAKGPVLVFSRQGGIDVEAHARDGGGGAGIVRRALGPLGAVREYVVRDALAEAGVAGADLAALTGILTRLCRAFVESDALLLEINPLARLADGTFLALDVHCELDEDGLGRQERLLRELGIVERHRPLRPATPFETAAAEIDRRDHRGVAGRVVEFDGDLGLLIGGGGASLAAFDAVRRHGGRPANYCEIGGNPSVAKVADLAELILSRPGVSRLAVIMNVVNNTRVDIVARGVIKAAVRLGRKPADAVAVFRVPGAWEEEGFALLRHWDIEPSDRSVSIDQAAARAVSACRS